MKTPFFRHFGAVLKNRYRQFGWLYSAVAIGALSLFTSQMHAQALDPETDVAQQNLRVITEDWADLQRAFKESDSLDSRIADFERGLASKGATITRLPDTSPHKAEMLAELNKIKADFPVQAKAAQGALEAKHLKEYWERDTADVAGWEAETPATFAAMLKQQSEAMSRLGMPKTAEMHQQATSFIGKTRPETDADAVKKLLADITKIRDASRAKLVKAATAIVDEAGKTKLTTDSRDRLESFANDDLRLSLGSAPEAASMKDRALAQVAAFDKAAGGTRAEIEKLSSDLNQQAAAAWPKLSGEVKTSSDFDAAAVLKDPGKYKGQRFLMSGVPNRMGWDFKPGDYDFARHQNGAAVVGKYDSVVRTEVEDTKKRLNLSDLPEEDYDLVAEVVGTAKAIALEEVEGEVKIEGTSTKLDLKGRREVKEDAVLLHIIGLHVGPVAVVAGAGAAQADGSIKSVSGPTGVAAAAAASGSFLWRLFWCLVGLIAGVLVLAKSGFPALAAVPQIQKTYQSLSASTLVNLGLVFLMIGLYSLLRGLIIYDLLVSASFILSGIFLALPFFATRKWLPENIAVQVHSKGPLIGLATVLIAILHLLFGGGFLLL